MKRKLKPIWDFETGAPIPPKEKKPELTWQDIAKILSIYELEISSGNVSRYGDASDVKPTSERILNKFNEMKK